MSAEKAPNIYGFNAADIDGNDVNMEKYKGKVVLIVNVASEWGLTKSNYAQLNQLHEKYSPELAIVGFPSNQFGSQEPGTNEQIKEFARQNQGAKFDLFAKVDVNGNQTIPLYQYLKKKATGTLTNAIKWNFTKFLVTKEGVAYKRYSPQTEPLKMVPDIEKLLN